MAWGCGHTDEELEPRGAELRVACGAREQRCTHASNRVNKATGELAPEPSSRCVRGRTILEEGFDDGRLVLGLLACGLLVVLPRHQEPVVLARLPGDAPQQAVVVLPAVAGRWGRGAPVRDPCGRATVSAVTMQQVKSWGRTTQRAALARGLGESNRRGIGGLRRRPLRGGSFTLWRGRLQLQLLPVSERTRREKARSTCRQQNELRTAAPG